MDVKKLKEITAIQHWVLSIYIQKHNNDLL